MKSRGNFTIGTDEHFETCRCIVCKREKRNGWKEEEDDERS